MLSPFVLIIILFVFLASVPEAGSSTRESNTSDNSSERGDQGPLAIRDGRLFTGHLLAPALARCTGAYMDCVSNCATDKLKILPVRREYFLHRVNKRGVTWPVFIMLYCVQQLTYLTTVNNKILIVTCTIINIIAFCDLKRIASSIIFSVRMYLYIIPPFILLKLLWTKYFM